MKLKKHWHPVWMKILFGQNQNSCIFQTKEINEDIKVFPSPPLTISHFFFSSILLLFLSILFLHFHSSFVRTFFHAFLLSLHKNILLFHHFFFSYVVILLSSFFVFTRLWVISTGLDSAGPLGHLFTNFLNRYVKIPCSHLYAWKCAPLHLDALLFLV